MSTILDPRAAIRCVCVLSLGSVALAQTTWYVDVNATPPGLGTPASPYASIQYAIDQSTTVAGDTVLVAPGTYPEKLAINKAIRVTSSNGPLETILLPSNGDDGVVLFGAIATTVFEGFTVSATTGWSGIYIGGGTVRGCIVRDCTGIGGIECPSGRIESTTVVHNLKHGIIGEPYGGSIELSNSIAWDNPWGNVASGGSLFVATYSAGFGSSSGGNVPGDPQFWDLARGDLRLRSGSPCIDAGDPASPLDPDGSRIDMGALTYDPTYAPAPISYCTGKLNSQGCTPAISAIGAASATSTGPFMVLASNEVDNKVGLFIFGFAESAQPFQGGTLCVAPPIKRAAVQNSSGTGPCTGHFRFFMQDYIQSGAHPGLVPGALVYGQWWSRDPLDPSGYGSGLSDALRFGIAP